MPWRRRCFARVGAFQRRVAGGTAAATGHVRAERPLRCQTSSILFAVFLWKTSADFSLRQIPKAHPDIEVTLLVDLFGRCRCDPHAFQFLFCAHHLVHPRVYRRLQCHAPSRLLRRDFPEGNLTITNSGGTCLFQPRCGSMVSVPSRHHLRGHCFWMLEHASAGARTRVWHFTPTSSLDDVSLHRLILLSSSRRVCPQNSCGGLSLPHSASCSEFALVYETVCGDFF